MLSNLTDEMESLADPEKARLLMRFFKTGKGQYGEGDVFIGLMVPQQRRLAKKYRDMPMADLQKLIRSNIHEHRLTALIILTLKYDKDPKKEFFDFYLKNTRYVNNWDLVDVTAPRIVGHYLFDKKRDILYRLAKSKSLWERRIAVVSTLYFISKGEFDDTLKISEMLLEDNHDLIHKAVGWMLREVGKRDQKAEESFLGKYHKVMPRTMLRYSIERFDEEKRKYYMRK